MSGIYPFLENKYTSTYFRIVAKANFRAGFLRTGVVGGEKHHIIPKSLGGSNDRANIVSLTPKEHFVCHRLLTRMTAGRDRSRMMYALWRLMGGHKNYDHITATRYERLKQQWRQTLSEDKERSRRISESKKGKRVKVGSERKPRKPVSDEYRQRLREGQRRRHASGNATSLETIQKIKKSWQMLLAANGGKHPNAGKSRSKHTS